MQRKSLFLHLYDGKSSIGMKAKFLRLFGMILTFLFGSLGLTSCVMYGSPYCDFTVKGKVTEKEGEPVPQAKVVVDAYNSWVDGIGKHYTNLDYTDTLYTDSEGRIEKSTVLTVEPSEVRITVMDADGATNGKFDEVTLENLELKQLKRGGKRWYQGSYEADFEAIVDIEK